MFIEQGVHPRNKFWKYLLGSVLIILASTIGQIPLLVAVFSKTILIGKGFPDEQDMMQLLDSNLTLFLIMISFVFAVMGIYFVLKYIHSQTIKQIMTSRPKIDWSRILFSFMIWGLFAIVSTVIMYYVSPTDFVLNFKLVPFIILFVIATIMIPIQTSCEELVFRGYLMQGFGNLALNKWFPLCMTSIIFGLLHLFNPEVDKIGYSILLYYIGTGFLLGIITLMDEGMELTLGFHAANNLIGALLVTTDWSVFQTNSILKDVSEPSAGFEVLMPLVIIYPLLLAIFSKKYNWKDWTNKLLGKINPIATQSTNIVQTQINENYEQSDLS